ncbi:MAG: FAD:protein FMN transferase [Gemmataceae bacterium]
MNRRDFLRPRQLAEAAGQILGALDVLPGDNAQADDSMLLTRAARRAMATSFEIFLPYGLPVEPAEEALNLIDELEDQLTVYRDSSEVSRLNREASTRAVIVEKGLFDLLQLAAQLSAETGGAFDVTTGPLIKVWGIHRRRQEIPPDEELQRARERTGMGHVKLDEAARSVRFERPGMGINLGSIGKGYALDRAGLLLRSRKISAGLLHGGHSSVYAIGSEPGTRAGWTVGLAHPWEKGRRLARVQLRDRALGTSAATFQHLEYNGRKLGHLLDPRTGWPAEGIASASVLAPGAARADALATAFFILGVDGAREYCRQHPEVGALLLPDGASKPVLFGLGPDEVTLDG